MGHPHPSCCHAVAVAVAVAATVIAAADAGLHTKSQKGNVKAGRSRVWSF